MKEVMYICDVCGKAQVWGYRVCARRQGETDPAPSVEVSELDVCSFKCAGKWADDERKRLEKEA